MSIIYLNHIFLKRISSDSFIYTCEKCNIEVWHNNTCKNENFYAKKPNEIQYNIKLTLTCEEQQIKTLVE